MDLIRIGDRSLLFPPLYPVAAVRAAYRIVAVLGAAVVGWLFLFGACSGLTLHTRRRRLRMAHFSRAFAAANQIFIVGVRESRALRAKVHAAVLAGVGVDISQIAGLSLFVDIVVAVEVALIRRSTERAGKRY